jgi:hypothetical protein
MKPDLHEMLERQAAWQRARAARPWAQKLRDALVLRRTLLALRRRSEDRSAARKDLRTD